MQPPAGRKPKYKTWLKRYSVYLMSLLVHGAAAGMTMVASPQEAAREPIVITVTEMAVAMPPDPPEPVPEEPPAPPEPPPPAPTPKPQPKPRPKPEPAPKAEAPPPTEEAAPADLGFADLGLVMGGGGPGGVAVAQAAPRQKTAAAPKVAAARKGPPPCAEPATKARPQKIVRPDYTSEAQQAEIEGPVRLEVVIGETGKVSSARILRGLGYGLDEAAVAAAKQMTFLPSQRCGRPVESTLTFNMRFSLGS